MERTEVEAPVAGCDLGKCTAKFAVGTVSEGGRLRVVSTEVVVHEGRPMAAFTKWHQRISSSCAALGATGLHAEELTAPAISRLPEDACLEAALAAACGLPEGGVNLVNLGARGYSVLSRDRAGRVMSLANDKCSSGTGETMVKIAGRFGLSIEEADSLAAAASRTIPITARCSVFAKSEMTHFGNQGRPVDALLRGYFQSVADNAAALLERIRVDGPIFVIGGGGRLPAVVEALSEALGQRVGVPEHSLHQEAFGALLLAAGQLRTGAAAPLPPEPDAFIRTETARFATLEPARAFAHRVTRMQAPPAPEAALGDPTVLGIDLGSTGSKAVLTSLQTGEAVLDVYDRTRGNPVDAAQRLIKAILDRATPRVRAIGFTGSGREAAARVARAACPGSAGRIVVINEIVAHATAAIRCDEDGGADLSVVEIGGQDAKYVSVVDGQIVSCDMNKVCSAGTGSFLEEQAACYGVHDVEVFTRMARRATRPPDLGQMCTVFVAEAAAEAHNEGFSLEDIFGGFQYAVIRNYLNRVMGQRSFASRIFFQGKPATGPSLAWTLAALTGREVIVPPNPGAMGAWGIGLCAMDALGREELGAGHALDLRSVLEARVIGQREFQCCDKRCATFCSIEKTTVSVAGTRQSVLSGGACPKFEAGDLAGPKLAREAPSAFDEREALLAASLASTSSGDSGRRVVGVPVFGAWAGYAPWLARLVHELGFEVRPMRSDRESLSRGEERCYSYDACAPAKIAHGALDQDLDAVLMPKLLTLGDRDGSGGKTCPMEQALPEMLRESLRARGRRCLILDPVLELCGRGRGGDALRHPRVARALRGVVEALGADPTRLVKATRRAAWAQADYERRLADIGRSTLDYGHRHGLVVIVVCGSLHVVHDRAINADVPRILRDNGVLALPMDCFPIPRSVHPLPRVLWAEPNRALRVALAARQRGGVYPLLLMAFGCGPGSFIEQVFEELTAGYPHTVLESDGHGGAAGYATRIEAFLHTVRKHHGEASPVARGGLRLLEPIPEKSLGRERGSRLVVFSIGDGISRIYAATYRSLGFDAVASGPTTAAALVAGRRDCSGKECLPYQMIWGAFRRHLDAEPPTRRTVLMQVAGEGLCRNCMFSIKDRMNLRRSGEQGLVDVRHVEMDEPAIGSAAMTNLWGGMVAWDILFQLASYLRPLERAAGQIDRLFEGLVDELVARVERPLGRGVRAGADTLRLLGWLHHFVGRACAAFSRASRPPREHPEHRTVLLTGDPYLRADEFASDDLIRKLNARGLRVLVEASTAVSEYMAHERLRDVVGLATGRLDNAAAKVVTRTVRRWLYARARAEHPWLFETKIGALLARAREVLNRYPQGAAPMAIGTTLHAWREGVCDGVVLASPWGCAPALVAESLLRHRRQIPILFVYCDGSPMDDRRLDSFAFRLLQGRSLCIPDSW